MSNDKTIIALANNPKDSTSDIVDMFIGQVSFGMDNCATHHISNDKSLFICKPEPRTKIWVTGVSGNCQAAGVGTIKFNVTADNDDKQFITLDNVIYLPQCAKNLI